MQPVTQSWWTDLTVADLDQASLRLRQALENPDVEQLREIGRLWCLLFALQRCEEMNEFLTILEQALNEISPQPAAAVCDWCSRYGAVIDSLMQTSAITQRWPERCPSVVLRLESLTTRIRDRCFEAKIARIRSTRPIKLVLKPGASEGVENPPSLEVGDGTPKTPSDS